jgi:single-strand DNA-binding protein
MGIGYLFVKIITGRKIIMSINKVILVGNLGKDPELKQTAGGASVCTFTLATTDRYKNKQGEPQEKTKWHNIVVWGSLAEICGKYLAKGKQVYIEGKIQNRSYDDRDGNKRYITEIVASDMQMLGRAGEQDRSDSRRAASSVMQVVTYRQDTGSLEASFDDEEPPF